MHSTTRNKPAPDPLDRQFRGQMAQMTGGLALSAFSAAWMDWMTHLALSPGRQLQLQQDTVARALDSSAFAMRALGAAGHGTLSPADGLDGAADKSFADPAWSQFPFNVLARTHQNTQALLKDSVRGVAGMSPYHADLLDFAVRMAADASSPANGLASNPELLAQTQSEQGQNLVRGLKHLAEDVRRTLQGGEPAGSNEFAPGQGVAVTPGKVVFRNELIEVIQYAPTTKDVHAEPVLIVPAWIMKYYILDLSPRNSMVKYLVDQGHTVFMMSWKNPGEKDRELGMADYIDLGLRAAVDVVARVVPQRKIHAVGYCIGGTLLSIGSAAMARAGDDRLGSVTMFAAQTDFSEPGELAFFINPGQLAALDATMHRKGVLESRQMGGAFALLRGQDLVWQPLINNYLKGRRDPMIDLMSWNADGTRMPFRMHTEYLHRLYLDNDLARNRYVHDGRRVRLSDIRVPMFVVGTEADHVAPWASVYKVDNLVRSDDFTFLLTAGGHNAGIVCGPVHPKRSYKVRTRHLADPHLAPEEWAEAAPRLPGSWWPEWQQWLARHSSGKVKPPKMGAAGMGCAVLEDAPGQYVQGR
jgi:polyhydroxyalkanoate synthase